MTTTIADLRHEKKAGTFTDRLVAVLPEGEFLISDKDADRFELRGGYRARVTYHPEDQFARVEEVYGESDVPREGERFRLRCALERYPHFSLPAGACGVVEEVQAFPDGCGARSISLKMDQHVEGASEWNNRVVWDDNGGANPVAEFWGDCDRIDRAFEMDGEPLDILDWVGANLHDPELPTLVEALSKLDVGDEYRIGGGAAAEFEIRMVR